MIVEASLTAQRMGLNPRAETVLGVRLQCDIREVARIGIGAGNGTHGMLAGTHVLRIDDDTPLRILVAWARTVIAALPADRRLLVVGDFFETGIR